MSAPMPTDQAVLKLLSATFGKSLTAKKTTAFDPKPRSAFTLAVFVDDANIAQAVCLCDMALSCALGGCLTTVPPGVVKDSVKAGVLEEVLVDNLKEVYNLLSIVFNLPKAPHLRLGDVFLFPQSEDPPDLQAYLKASLPRLDVEVNIPNYGLGKISFKRLS